MSHKRPATGRELLIDYTNHRGERRLRLIEPLNVWWGKSACHEVETWILHALDLEDTDSPMKDFLLVNVHQILPWAKGRDEKGWVCGLCDGLGYCRDVSLDVNDRCPRCHGTGHLP